jgi:hypothetical protein
VIDCLNHGVAVEGLVVEPDYIDIKIALNPLFPTEVLFLA